MNERQRYISILNRMQKTAYRDLSKEDQDFFLTYSLQFDDNKLKELQKEQANLKPGERLSDEKITALQEEAFKSLTSPENKEILLRQAEELQSKQLSGKLRQGINLVLAGNDLSQANSQIRQYKDLVSKSRRPSRPPVLERDPYLKYAKDSALGQSYAPSMAVEASKQGINDAYLGDLQNARIASAGQPGAYGAYAQAATNRRGRRSLELAPVADQIQQGLNARVDRLAGLSAQENQAINESAGRYYPSDLEQYRAEQNAMAGFGANAYSNRRDSLYNLGRALPDMLAEQQSRKRYGDMWNQLYATGYDPKIATAVTESDRRLNDRWNNVYNNEIL